MDRVGKVYVFNVAGNLLRIIAAVHCNRGRVYIRDILMQSEFDEEEVAEVRTMGAAAKDVATEAVAHWRQVAPVLTAPRSEEDCEQLATVLDEVLDAGGADENSPLATLA